MVAKPFKDIAKAFDPKSGSQYEALEQLTQIYPFFATPWAYLAKAAQVQKKMDAERIIERAATLANNRAVFKDWMEIEVSAPSKFSEKKTHKPIPKKKTKTTTKKENITPNSKKNTTKDSPLRIEKKKAKRTFLDWLDQDEKPSITLSKSKGAQWDVIDSFIENNPKISSSKEISPAKNINLAKRQTFDKEELMTETLAKILVQQKKYNKAVKAYKILSLKYPEKNTFFANQIFEIKRLIEEAQ